MSITKKQQNKICQMRLDGVGYKKIAVALRLTRDEVRAYCKRHGLQGYAYLRDSTQQVPHQNEQNDAAKALEEIAQKMPWR